MEGLGEVGGGFDVGEPGLAAGLGESLEKGLAACGIEVGGEFIDKHQRRFLEVVFQQGDVGRHPVEQTAFMLAGGGLGQRNLVAR